MTDAANPSDDDADRRLIDLLRHVVGLADPVPERVLHAARGSFAWRTIDAELAELAYDSAADAEAALVRTTGAKRLLTFDAAGITVELEVAEAEGRRRLEGQLVPPQRAAIEVRHAGGIVETEADELGRFSADGLEHGPVSLLCRLHDGDGAPIVTDWLVI